VRVVVSPLSLLEIPPVELLVLSAPAGMRFAGAVLFEPETSVLPVKPPVVAELLPGVDMLLLPFPMPPLMLGLEVTAGFEVTLGGLGVDVDGVVIGVVPGVVGVVFWATAKPTPATTAIMAAEVIKN
jgi:hypothetical protein